MLSTPPASRASSPNKPAPVYTPVHRSSRRLLGLAPEFSTLPEKKASARHVRQEPPMEQAQASQVTFHPQVTFQHPREPEIFHGDLFEDVEDWLNQFERVASFNQWNEAQKLRQVYFSLDHDARTWLENREGSLRTWEEFCQELREAFSSTDRREHAQRLLESRIRKPNESVIMFSEHMARLFRKADPDMSEPKKLRYLMHGVKEQLFAGLVRNPPRTVREFVKEATAIERALQDRCRQYDRSSNASLVNTAVLSAVNESSLRDLVRSIVREELQKHNVRPNQPVRVSVAEVVREEIRQALALPEQYPEEPQVNYANVLARPQFEPQVSYANVLTRPQFHRSTAPRRQPVAGPGPRPEPRPHPQVRKTDVWRTADNRPLCYHCGEADHVYRRCPYREIGLPGFSPSAPRPRFGERPPQIEDYLATRATARLRPRSPSPGRVNSPPNVHRSRQDVPRGRSPSPGRRGN